MIGRRPSKSKAEPEEIRPKGFDDYDVRLGDLMRGERATMGKSLLDVQRELRIKAAYIAAIENCNPEAFDTPGFIAGYVRSYARYLGMNPDVAFDTFCAESGFSVAHGMMAEASGGGARRNPKLDAPVTGAQSRDIFAAPATPFVPKGEALFARVEPGAIVSVLVLLVLITGIGFGGWSLLRQVQQVQLAPIEQTPTVLTDTETFAASEFATGGDITPSLGRGEDASRSRALDRLYRPQALDVPVLDTRDAPIATLDPDRSGAFATGPADAPAQIIETPLDEADPEIASRNPVPQVLENIGPTLRMVAAYPSWVRVRGSTGTTLFEGIMQPGDTWDVPVTEVAPTLRTGESGAIYFAMGSDCFGPVGARGAITKNLALDRVALAESFERVIPGEGGALDQMFADLSAIDPARLPAIPCQTN